jgi:hypothetical protein
LRSTLRTHGCLLPWSPKKHEQTGNILRFWPEPEMQVLWRFSATFGEYPLKIKAQSLETGPRDE